MHFMGLSTFMFTNILLLLLSVHLLQAQFWSPRQGQCYGRFERYNQCATTCPDTCDDIRWPNPMKICNMMCRIGCECIPPFVRSNQNPMSPCIHPRRCRFM